MRPFYGKEISPDQQQVKIQKILHQFKHYSVSPELKKLIYDALTEAKARGEITIPFKVVLHDLKSGRRPYIEVILETKV
jgi:hypothetical protein